MKQGMNPFLPLDEYIPDGEPHVFGDKIYLFGSHDKEGGSRYCEEGNYVLWSAPLASPTRALKNTGLSNFIFKDIRNPLVSD